MSCAIIFQQINAVTSFNSDEENFLYPKMNVDFFGHYNCVKQFYLNYKIGLY